MTELIPPQQPPSPQTKGTSKKVIFWIVFGLIIMMAGFSALVIVAIYAQSEYVIDTKDKAVLVKAKDLRSFITFTYNPSYEHYKKKWEYMDQTYTLSYEYEPKGEKLPILSSELVLHTSTGDAIIGEGLQWHGMGLGIKIVSAQVTTNNKIFKWGDSSRWGLISNKHGPIGNVFVARKGNKVFSMYIMGVYFADKKHASDFLLPTLKRLDTYKPSYKQKP